MPLQRFVLAGASILAFALPSSAQTWQDITANLPAEPTTEQFSPMASDGSRLYVLGRKGVLVSADGGASFTAINDVSGGGPDLAEQSLRMVKFVNGEVWISGSGVTDMPGVLGARLHRLVPGETIWQPSDSGIPVSVGNADDIDYDPASGAWFVTLSTGQIYVSIDDGQSWTLRDNGLGGIGSPSSVVAVGGAVLTSRPLAGVRRTTDQGANWSASLSGGSSSPGTMIAQDGRVLFSLGRTIHFSDDAGASWAAVPNVPHGSSVIKSGGGIVFAFSRDNTAAEAIAYSASGGLTWRLLPKDGLPTREQFVFTGYYPKSLYRHGDHLYLLGETLNSSFMAEATHIHRMDISGFEFVNPLEIVVHPESRGMLVGQSHLLEVYAGGENLSYQWQQDGEDIPGATSRTWPLENVTLDKAGDYTVTVSSPGETPVISAVATVSVSEPEPGRWDPVFDQTDINFGGRVHLRPGGEAIVVKTHSHPLVLARIGPDGGRLQYKTTNTTTSNKVSSSLVDRDDRIVATFKHSSNGNSLQRFDIDSFNFLSTLSLGPNTSSVRVQDMVEVPGKGYVIVGTLVNVGTDTTKHIALIGYDNVMDPTFAPGTGPDASSLSRVTYAPDGNVWACGQGISTWSGIPASRGLVRIDSTGAIHGVIPDVGSGRANFVHALSDNRVLVLFGASGARVLYALHPNGNRDTTFNAADHTITDIERVAEQPDGKIILVGNFSSFGGVPAAGYIRLNPDGTVDDSFYCATGFSSGTVNDVTYDPRGYIYLSSTAHSSATFQGQPGVGGGPVRIFASAEAGSGGGSGGTFAEWEALQSLPENQRGANASPAGDGVANLVKYAVGGEPFENVFDRLPVVGETVVGNEVYPTVSFIRNTGAEGIVVDVEVAADLDFTTDLGSTLVSTEDLGDGTERITIRSNASYTSQPRQFLRLRVTEE